MSSSCKLEITLFGSSIASLVKRNPYRNVIEEFEKLLKKTNKKQFNIIHEKGATEQVRKDNLKTRYQSIYKESERLKWKSDTVDKVHMAKEMTKAKTNELIQDKESAYKDICDDQEYKTLCKASLEGCLDQVRSEVEEICSLNTLRSLDSVHSATDIIRVVEQDTKVPRDLVVQLRDVLQGIEENNAAIAQSTELAKEAKVTLEECKEDIQELNDIIVSSHNTHFGIRYENNSLETFSKEYNMHVNTPKNVFKRKVYEDDTMVIILAGKIDGIIEEDLVNGKPCLVEIKNRVRGFFPTLVEYEKVQIQSYMYILDVEQCFLIQSKKGESVDIRVDLYAFEDVHFATLKDDIISFCKSYAAIYDDASFLDEYAKCKTQSQKIMKLREKNMQC